jgi:transmembrane sensor
MSEDDLTAPLSDDERLLILLDRYLAGEVLDSGATTAQEWISSDPSREALVEELRRIRAVASAGRHHRSADEAWRRLMRFELGQEQGTRVGAVHMHGNTGHRKGVWFAEMTPARSVRSPFRYARIAAVLFAAGIAFMATHRVAPVRAPALRPTPRVATQSFVTLVGRRGEVRLADGTRITLAPRSRLTIPIEQDSLSRDVDLVGEAYFDVVHDAQRPFRVHVRNAVIRDIGTRFAVLADTTDSLVRVVVTHGEVRVRSQTAPAASGALLTAGMLGSIDAQGATLSNSAVDTARYVAFVKSQMKFVRTPLRTVIREIERWYDVDIRLGDPAVGDRRITATLDHQSLSALLDQLSVTLNLHVARTGRSVVLTMK